MTGCMLNRWSGPAPGVCAAMCNFLCRFNLRIMTSRSGAYYSCPERRWLDPDHGGFTLKDKTPYLLIAALVLLADVWSCICARK